MVSAWRVVLVAASLFAGGCATSHVIVTAPVPAPQARIPPGHMPPPGNCRIWYPERPPGEQPSPGDCGALRHGIPPGAWLVRS